MIEALLGKKFQEYTDMLTNQAGLSQIQAEQFIPEAAKNLLNLIQTQTTSLNFNDLASSAQSIIASLDFSSISRKVGISIEQARNSVEMLLPSLLDLAEQNQAQLQMFTSMFSQNSGLAGIMSSFGAKLFNSK